MSSKRRNSLLRKVKLKVVNQNLTRRKIVVALLITLLLVIGYMSLGGSITDSFFSNGEPSTYRSEPESTDFPNQGPGGFNLSDDFYNNLPNFNPPADLIGDPGNFGDLPSPPDDGGDTGGGDDGGNSGGGGNVNPGDGPSIDPDPPSPGNGGDGDTSFTPPDVSGGSENEENRPVVIGERPNKARNLPNATIFFPFGDIFDLSFLNTLFENLDLSNTRLIFLVIIVSSLYFDKMIIPNLLDEIYDEFEETDKNKSNLFISPKEDPEAIKRKKEREQRLIIFKDHVQEIIQKSRLKLESGNVSEMIISGYHELDRAFEKFSRLKRSKFNTPLEHARKHFETGEIDNKVLEKIVDLFYLTRFGNRELLYEDGEKFLDYLENLVVIEIKQLPDML